MEKRKDETPGVTVDKRTRYGRRKKWLEKTAEALRTTVKIDCAILMKYLDAFPPVTYTYKAAVMTGDSKKFKGYIPDMLIQIEGGEPIVIDFINEKSEFYSPERVEEKMRDLQDEGYNYFVFPRGTLSGKNHITPEDMMVWIANYFGEK